MKFNYGAFDGKEFPTPDSLFPEAKVVQFILQYGQQALDAMQNLEGDGEEQYIQSLIDAGLLEKVEDGDGKGTLRLTPRMLKGIEHKVLLDIFQSMRKGSREGHPTEEPGRIGEREEGTRPYEFGDPLSELELGATLRNALARQMAEQHGMGDGGAGVPPVIDKAAETSVPSTSILPLHIRPTDFELYQTEGAADCATVVLIDQSGSMMRWGRFYQAKRVALGLTSLIHNRFPQDTIDFVGFYTLAQSIAERDLPLVMPKPISVRDYEVRVRVPLEEARREEERLPLHFTNLQLGLRLARQMLNRRGAANKQIFVITDGQPTAHVQANDQTGGDMLYLLYPPSEQTATVTLKEAMRCQQQDIRIATFALIEDYWGMDWVGFVDRLTRLTRGMAYYCTSEDLSSTVIESYLSGRKKKSFIH